MQDGDVTEALAEWGTYQGRTGERAITNPAEARALCDELEAIEPDSRMLVGFTTAQGHFFAIGLGAQDSCAMYWESVDPPYFQSRGDQPASETIDFAYGGQESEFPGTVRIEREAALAALSEFIETGKRPACVEWEET